MSSWTSEDHPGENSITGRTGIGAIDLPRFLHHSVSVDEAATNTFFEWFLMLRLLTTVMFCLLKASVTMVVVWLFETSNFYRVSFVEV